MIGEIAHGIIYNIYYIIKFRPHEVGITSNRGSGCRGEYVTGPLAHTARHVLEVYLARRFWNKPFFEVL